MKKKGSSGRLLECVTSVYVVLMFTVFLLWPGAEGYTNISSAKYTLFLVLCGGYAGLMLLLSLEELLIGAVRPKSPLTLLKAGSWTQRFVLLYLLLTWISALLSPHWPQVIRGVSRNEGALTITIYCICFFFVSAYIRFRPWMLGLLAGALLVFDVLCIIQMTGANPFMLYPEGMTWFDSNIRYSGAYLGTIGNVDHVASFLCVAVPLLWTALLRLKGKQRILWAAALVLTLIVLARMWVLAAVVGVVLGFLLSVPVVVPVSSKGRKRMALAVAVVLILGVGTVFLFDLGGMLHEIHELLHGRGEDSFGSGRLYIWREVLALVPERLWLGYGPDTMLLAGIEPFSRVDEALGTVIRAHIDTAHNEYLNILFHQGLLALAAYIGALIAAAVGWIRRSREDWVDACAGAAVLCYCIQAFFGISVCITAPYFWIALAILDSRCRQQNES